MRCGQPGSLHADVLMSLICETSTFAVAVNAVDGDGAGAEDGEWDEQRQASVHAYVHTLMYIDTFLSIREEDGCQQAQKCQYNLHFPNR